MRFAWGTATTTTWSTNKAARVSLTGLCLVLFWSAVSSETELPSSVYVEAHMAYSYVEPESGNMVLEGPLVGHYGTNSVVMDEAGDVVHVLDEHGANHGCRPYVNGPFHDPARSWVALVQRGACRFQDKLDVAVSHNASAMVVYNNKSGEEIVFMTHKKDANIVTVFISKKEGDRIAHLVDTGHEVFLNISVGDIITIPPLEPAPNKLTTIVLLTFVGLLIVGLIIVVVYAVKHQAHLAQAFNLQETPNRDDSLLQVYTEEGHDLQALQPLQSQQQQQQQQQQPQPEEQEENQQQQQQQQQPQRQDAPEQECLLEQQQQQQQQQPNGYSMVLL